MKTRETFAYELRVKFAAKCLVKRYAFPLKVEIILFSEITGPIVFCNGPEWFVAITICNYFISYTLVAEIFCIRNVYIMISCREEWMTIFGGSIVQRFFLSLDFRNSGFVACLPRFFCLGVFIFQRVCQQLLNSLTAARIWLWNFLTILSGLFFTKVSLCLELYKLLAERVW